MIGEPRLHSEAEHALFAAEIARARTYLEYGMGGSTVRAAEAGIARIAAVDSDRAWVEALKERLAGRPGIELLFRDIGPIKEWGIPRDRTGVERWPDYVAAPWLSYREEGIIPELVFVDGRFRVAAMLYSLALADGAGRMRLMVHDFPERRHYAVVLRHANVVAAADRLVVLSRKPSVRMADLVADLHAWLLDWR